MELSMEALERSELSRSLDENVETFKRLLRGDVNSDAQFRRLSHGGVDLCVMYMEGMADDRKISDFILRPCERSASEYSGIPDARYFIGRVIEIPQCETERRVGEILDQVVTGMTALLIDGCDEAVLTETRGYPARPVNKTTNESVVIGAQEGFVESLRTNMTLMRRYLPSPRLITECLTVGTRVPCHVALV